MEYLSYLICSRIFWYDLTCVVTIRVLVLSKDVLTLQNSELQVLGLDIR